MGIASQAVSTTIVFPVLSPPPQVVGSASQAVSVMNAASYALLEVEAAMRSAEAPDVARLARATAVIEAANAAVAAMQELAPHRHPPPVSSSSPTPSSHTVTTLPLSDGVDGEEGGAVTVEGRRRVAHLFGHPTTPSSDGAATVSIAPTLAQDAAQISSSETASQSPSSPALGRHHGVIAPHAVPPPSPPPPIPTQQMGWGDRALPHWLSARLEQLRARDKGLKSARTVSMLKQVLETFTDVTRYPRCERKLSLLRTNHRDIPVIPYLTLVCEAQGRGALLEPAPLAMHVHQTTACHAPPTSSPACRYHAGTCPVALTSFPPFSHSQAPAARRCRHGGRNG